MKQALDLYNPVQAHQALTGQLWPAVKSLLLAGHCLTLELRTHTRTNPQNRLMWAMLGDVARQVDWHGQKLDSADWKHIFSASLNNQRAVPGLNGGFVVLATKTSRMTKQEMSDLIELMAAFGAQRDVIFTKEKKNESNC
jgi:hypothetical protein